MLSGCVPWPEELAERYRREGYWEDVTLGALLRASAAAHPERIALVSGDERLTYAELDERADRLAAGLADLGLEAGDRVVVHLPNVGELLVLCFALFRLGALPVLALPEHREHEIGHLCELAEARAYAIPDVHRGFDARELARKVAPEFVLVAGEPEEFIGLASLEREPRELPEPPADDVALFLLSGGTTGLPKLIPRTHNDFICGLRASGRNALLDEHSVYLAVLPVAHNYALAAPGVLATLDVGGTVVLAASGSPDEAFELIERECVTHTGLVPALALVWMDAAADTTADLSSLELVQVGGAKFGAEDAQRLGPTLGCALQQSFGMGEGILSQSRRDDPEELTIRCQGHPVSPGDEVRVVDGELHVRGPYTIQGYYRAEEYNARAFTPDGWLRTGDLARVTESGHLMIEGRVKDVINRGGDKVGAEEVEDHLVAHPNVASAALVAMPDRQLGERSCAFIVARGEAPTLPDLVRTLRDRGLASFKLPDRLEVVDALPLTPVGKVDKAELRRRGKRPEGAAAHAPDPETPDTEKPCLRPSATRKSSRA